MTFIQNNLRTGSLKTCNIAYNYQSENLTDVAIPTDEPASPQVSYTIDASMFPVLLGDQPYSVSYVGGVLAGGINNGSGALTLNYRVKVNGTSVANGSQSVPAGQRFCVNGLYLQGTYIPKAGDVVNVYLWCPSNGTDLVTKIKGLEIVPGVFKPVDDSNKLLVNTNWVCAYSNAVPTGFTSSISSYSAVMRKYVLSNYFTINNGIFSFRWDHQHSAYGIFVSNIVVSPYAAVRTHSSNYNIEPFTIPSQVQWQETDIKYLGA